MIITGSLAAALRLGLRDSVIVTVLDSDPGQVPGRVRVTSPPGRRGSDSESVTRRPGPGVTHMMRPVRRTSLSDSHSLPVSLTESHGVWPGPGRRQLWILSSQNDLRFFCGLSEAAEDSRCNGCSIKSVSESLGRSERT